ncbi:MAG: hypothetical protein LBS57_11695 [Treponema sp.]|nr:hypothetical protein [Treponema sp.]
MKKTMLFVFAGLVIACLPAFALGSRDSDRERDIAEQKQVAEVADVAAVEDIDYMPRQNPGVQRASGSIYALPASPLAPEAERLPPPVYAISGVRGQEIQEGNPWEVVDIVITLPEKETFSRGILEGEDVSNWIRNLPEGLEARAHGIKKGATSVKIYISGTPAVTVREVVRVSIPGTYLASGSSRDFISPTEEESFKSWEASQTQ